ncbi:MAG: neuromedin U [Planctomycetota bacterium]|jgi:hypothetical protein
MATKSHTLVGAVLVGLSMVSVIRADDAPEARADAVARFLRAASSYEPVPSSLLALAAAPEPEKKAEPSAEDLRAKAQNPIANLITVPIEATFDFGATNGNAIFIQFQPVIPIKTKHVLFVNRTIIPLISAPGGITGQPGNPEPTTGGYAFGLGDILHSTFLVPAKASKVTWGVGPAIGFPTATSDQLGSGKWTLGPTAVVLTQPKPWSLGLLVANLWSIAGDSDRDNINQMIIQPFVSYNMDGGWFLTTSPIITANWGAESSQRWTVPLGGGVGRMFSIGEQPVNAFLQAFYMVEAPDGAPDWQIRFTFQFLFPQ